ncbi:IS30 family transposase [Streptomyces scabiei]|uniref:IS30 family transposase n=2 Tax=Streptomyces TaxID=1883 RepID=UPI000765EBAE|nr:IS30 family transposase [Streptomyces scabiei]MDX2659057.1 IS30 family transposase [Streptomyces scabiei]MDX2996566.1 IS30 family transposase [Streptomyces scabiei]MDX3281531.1 IS30 family transposase [Streptomyces scabiei]
MSDEMKADLWRRWRSGESISVISRQIGKPPGSVFTVLKHHGGIAPVPRKARAGSLTMGEREEISRGLCAGDSYRAIAGLLGRAVSTISREINNNGGRDVYRAIAAQERALDRARRPKQCLLARRPALRETVLLLLREEWSPAQIVGHLRRHHGDDPGMEISHETIYRSVYTTRWKVIPRELSKRLRTGRPIRKNKRHTVKGQWRSQITDARPIEDRPQAAEDRSEFGHLEGDLVIGSNNSQVATLVDRKPRFLTVVKLASRHTTVVVPAPAETYERMDSRLRSTLTWDRGMELAAHKLPCEASYHGGRMEPEHLVRSARAVRTRSSSASSSSTRTAAVFCRAIRNRLHRRHPPPHGISARNGPNLPRHMGSHADQQNPRTRFEAERPLRGCVSPARSRPPRHGRSSSVARSCPG